MLGILVPVEGALAQATRPSSKASVVDPGSGTSRKALIVHISDINPAHSDIDIVVFGPGRDGVDPSPSRLSPLPSQPVASVLPPGVPDSLPAVARSLTARSSSSAVCDDQDNLSRRNESSGHPGAADINSRLTYSVNNW